MWCVRGGHVVCEVRSYSVHERSYGVGGAVIWI